jgi:hypothetical protein
MKLKKIDVVRAMGIFLIATSSVAFSFADGPSTADSQKPYCLQSAQAIRLSKSFKINEKELTTILREGRTKETSKSMNNAEMLAIMVKPDGQPLTRLQQCSQLLEWAINNLDHQVIAKFDQTGTVNTEIDKRPLVSNEYENLKKLALLGAQDPISCKEVKGLLQKILAASKQGISPVEKELTDWESSNAISAKTIVNHMCGAGKSAPQGMTPDQKNKLAAGVAAALPSMDVFSDGKSASANPPAQSSAMGNLGAQKKGKSHVHKRPHFRTHNSRIQLQGGGISLPSKLVNKKPLTQRSSLKIQLEVMVAESLLGAATALWVIPEVWGSATVGAAVVVAAAGASVGAALGVVLGGAVGAGAVAAWNAWNHYKSPSSNSNSTDSKSSKTPASPAPAAAEQEGVYPKNSLKF